MVRQMLFIGKALKVAKSGQKWPKVAKSGPKGPKVAKSGPKWPKVAQSGPKWFKVAQTVKVAQSGPDPLLNAYFPVQQRQPSKSKTRCDIDNTLSGESQSWHQIVDSR